MKHSFPNSKMTNNKDNAMTYKKIMILGLFLFSAWSIVADEETPVPYEKYIAKEYNRIRAGADKYSSFHEIMNQGLRGKSIEQKNKIIADLKALKSAVNAAYNQAELDGKSLWYYFYIWKDNNPAIQALIQYEYDVDYKIATSQMEMQPDIIRALRYVSGFATGALVALTALYFSQHYLSHENYVQNKHHGFIEIMAAPASAGLDIATEGMRYLLAGVVSAASGLKNAADAGVGALAKNPPIEAISAIPAS